MKIKITPALFYTIVLLLLMAFTGVIIMINSAIRSLNSTWIVVLCCVITLSAIVIDIVSRKRSIKEVNGLLRITKPVLGEMHNAFVTFFDLYKTNQKAFISRNKSLLKKYDNFNPEHLKSIELFFLFASFKNMTLVTDWKGEENESEIETFLKTLTGNPYWENAKAFRATADKAQSRGGKSIIGLLKAVDKDLQERKQRLLFIDMGWDAYVFTCVNNDAYNEITAHKNKFFYNIDKLG